MIRNFLWAIIVMSCVQNMYGSQEINLGKPVNQRALDESYEEQLYREFDQHFAGGSNQPGNNQGNDSDTEEVDYDQETDDEESFGNDEPDR